MSIGEFIARLAAAIKPIIWTSVIVLGITVVVISVLFAMTVGTWVDQKGFAWYGIFFGLKGWSLVQLSAVWLLFLFYFCFLIPTAQLGSVQYILIAMLILLSAIDIRNPKNIPARLVLYFFQLLGLFCANTVWSYIQDKGAVTFLWISAYVIMAVFLAVYNFYLLMTGLDVVSQGRRIELENN